MSPNRLGVLTSAVVAAAVLTGCGGGGSDAKAAPPTTAPGAAGTSSSAPPTTAVSGGDTVIDIVNYKFSRPAVTVKAGSTVTWVNKDSFEHTATAPGKTFDTMKLAEGKAGKVRFDQIGTFEYHCDIHQYMTGQITVT